MCSHTVVSVLQSKSKDALQAFQWSKLAEQMIDHAPLLTEILTACVHSKSTPNTDAIVGLCGSIFNCRNKSMNLVQKIISIILYSEHSGKQILS